MVSKLLSIHGRNRWMAKDHRTELVRFSEQIWRLKTLVIDFILVVHILPLQNNWLPLLFLLNGRRLSTNVTVISDAQDMTPMAPRPRVADKVHTSMPLVLDYRGSVVRCLLVRKKEITSNVVLQRFKIAWWWVVVLHYRMIYLMWRCIDCGLLWHLLHTVSCFSKKISCSAWI